MVKELLSVKDFEDFFKDDIVLAVAKSLGFDEI